MTLFESQHPWEQRERERAVPTCQPLRLPFISLVYYVCVRFYLRFDFYIVYLLFLCLLLHSLVCSLCVCVKVYIFICFDSKLDVFMTRLDSKQLTRLQTRLLAVHVDLFFYYIAYPPFRGSLLFSHIYVWVSAHFTYSCSPCMTLIEKPTALHTLHWPTKNEQQKFNVCCYGKSEDQFGTIM